MPAGGFEPPDLLITNLKVDLSTSVIPYQKRPISNNPNSARFRYVLAVSSRRRYYVVTESAIGALGEVRGGRKEGKQQWP